MIRLIVLTVLLFPTLSYSTVAEETDSEMMRIVCTSIDPDDNEEGRLVVLDQLVAPSEYPHSSSTDKGFDKLVSVNTGQSGRFAAVLKVLNCSLVDSKKPVFLDRLLELNTAQVSQRIASDECRSVMAIPGQAYRIGPRMVFEHLVDLSSDSDKKLVDDEIMPADQNVTSIDMAYNFAENMGKFQFTRNKNYQSFLYFGESQFRRLMCMRPYRLSKKEAAENTAQFE